MYITSSYSAGAMIASECSYRNSLDLDIVHLEKVNIGGTEYILTLTNRLTNPKAASFNLIKYDAFSAPGSQVEDTKNVLGCKKVDSKILQGTAGSVTFSSRVYDIELNDDKTKAYVLTSELVPASAGKPASSLQLVKEVSIADTSSPSIIRTIPLGTLDLMIFDGSDADPNFIETAGNYLFFINQSSGQSLLVKMDLAPATPQAVTVQQLPQKAIMLKRAGDALYAYGSRSVFIIKNY